MGIRREEGKRPFTVRVREFAEEGPEVRLRQVNAVTAEGRVMTKNAATLLLAASWRAHCREFKPVFHAVADVYADENIRFFWTNAPENDLPSFIPDHSGFPVLRIWPAGENYTRPVEYKEERDWKLMVNWVHENSALDIPVPVVNATEIQEKISEYKKSDQF